MTLFDDVVNLIDLVGSQDCIHGTELAFMRCDDPACAPCLAMWIHQRIAGPRPFSAAAAIADAIAELADINSRGVR